MDPEDKEQHQDLMEHSSISCHFAGDMMLLKVSTFIMLDEKLRSLFKSQMH